MREGDVMYDLLSKHYNSIFPEHPALPAFISSYLKSGKIAYDLGCGTGRLTALIAAGGMRVTGIDSEKAMIDEAKQTYPDLSFRAMDMTEIPETRKVHLVTCFGNTIAHLSPDRLDTFIMKLKRMLHKEGHIVIQMLNYTRIIKNRITVLPVITTDDLVFERTYAFETGHLAFHIKLTKVDGTVYEDQTRLYPYTDRDMAMILDRHRFQHHSYGSLAHRKFADNDYYLYLVLHH